MIARAIRGDTFPGLIDYVINRRNLHPDAVRLSLNLLGLKTAAREMTIVAQGNRRCVKPVRHLILAWHEREQPTIGQQHACAEALLERLGVAAHQSIRVVHTEDKTSARASGDGRHHEIHIVVNAVGSNDKAPVSTRNWSTIEKVTARIASEHGFAEIPGRFNGVGTGPESSRNGKARSVAAQTGIATIVDEISMERDRYQALKDARKRGAETGSWDPLLHELHRQGLRLEQGKDRGKNRVRGLVLVDRGNPKRRQKISALDEPGFKWGEGALTKDLGPAPQTLAVDVSVEATADGLVPVSLPEPTAEPKPQSTPKTDATQDTRIPDPTAEIERRMRAERSRIHAEFEKVQSEIRTRREQTLGIKKAAWKKFQARRKELLAAARVRRTYVYNLLRRYPLIRKVINDLFDHDLDRRIADARDLFTREKALPLPKLNHWTTWSRPKLDAARERVRRDLHVEMAVEQERCRRDEAKKAERARQHALSRNRSLIGLCWWADPTDDSCWVPIRWNSSKRQIQTVASTAMVAELRQSGIRVEEEISDMVVHVSVVDLANWMGVDERRRKIVTEAAASSRREERAIRADQEKEDRKTAERKRQHRLATNQQRIREHFGLDPESDHVVIQWNSAARSAATAPSLLLVQELRSSRLTLKDVAGTDAVSISVSALTGWIGTENGPERVDRLSMVNRAGPSSRREAGAVRADKEEAARKAIEQERQRDLATNQRWIRELLRLDLASDRVVIQWNSTARSAATAQSLLLVQELRSSRLALEDVAGAEGVSVFVSTLAEWIGTENHLKRGDRFTMVDRAGAASRREADAVRADTEEAARKAAEQERQRQAEALRHHYLANNQQWIREDFGLDPESDRVVIQWNSAARSAATAPSLLLVQELRSSQLTLEDVVGPEAVSVPVSALAGWIGDENENGSKRGDRLTMVERAGVASRREADAVRADREEAARKAALEIVREAQKAEDARKAAEAARAEEAEQPQIWTTGTQEGRKLTVPIKPLRKILRGIDPEGRAQRNKLGQTYADASRDSDRRAAEKAADRRALVRKTVMGEAAREKAKQVQVSAKAWVGSVLAKWQVDPVEANAWADGWIERAPRSASAPDYVTWTLSGNPKDNSVFSELQSRLTKHPTQGLSAVLQNRELNVPIEPLRSHLRTVKLKHRAQWDDLGEKCEDASRDNVDRAREQQKCAEVERESARQSDLKAAREPIGYDAAGRAILNNSTNRQVAL